MHYAYKIFGLLLATTATYTHDMIDLRFSWPLLRVMGYYWHHLQNKHGTCYTPLMIALFLWHYDSSLPICCGKYFRIGGDFRQQFNIDATTPPAISYLYHRDDHRHQLTNSLPA